MQHIFNVGNKNTVTVKKWVELCYEAAGEKLNLVSVSKDIEQRKYFPFYDYEYYLDVSKQYELMPETKMLAQGLKESFEWYLENKGKVIQKPLIEYIDSDLK